MSTVMYAHCRGCGRPIDDIVDHVDGICSTARAEGRTCAGVLNDWVRIHRPAAMCEVLSSPEWHIAIDEWLAATR